jgi:glucose-1-phosphate cytidylyltransferase
MASTIGICSGHKDDLVKEYFASYLLHMSDVVFHAKLNSMEVHHMKAETWGITLIDTGVIS